MRAVLYLVVAPICREASVVSWNSLLLETVPAQGAVSEEVFSWDVFLNHSSNLGKGQSPGKRSFASAFSAVSQ